MSILTWHSYLGKQMMISRSTETIAGLKYSWELYVHKLHSKSIRRVPLELQTSTIPTVPLQPTRRDMIAPKVGTLLNTARSVSKHYMHPFSIVTDSYLNRGNTTSAHIGSPSASGTSPATNGTTDPSGHVPASPIRRRTSNQESKP
jgi:hypothetical protein